MKLSRRRMAHAESQMRFPAAVDMPEASCACLEMLAVLSTGISSGNHDRLPKPARPCHQIDHSVGSRNWHQKVSHVPDLTDIREVTAAEIRT